MFAHLCGSYQLMEQCGFLVCPINWVWPELSPTQGAWFWGHALCAVWRDLLPEGPWASLNACSTAVSNVFLIFEHGAMVSLCMGPYKLCQSFHIPYTIYHIPAPPFTSLTLQSWLPHLFHRIKCYHTDHQITRPTLTESVQHVMC